MTALAVIIVFTGCGKQNDSFALKENCNLVPQGKLQTKFAVAIMVKNTVFSPRSDSKK